MRKKRKLGLGFADEVSKATGKTGHFQNSNSPNWTDILLPNFRSAEESSVYKSPWRIIIFSGFSLVLFFIIFLRLFHLQIAQGSANRELADGNRIQVKIIHAPRGVIYDRNGKILASNSPAFRLNDPASKGHKVRFISREQALEWEANDDQRFPNLEIDNIRHYPLGEQFAHVVGFMGEISGEQLTKKEFENYLSGDQIGQFGLEARYESFLRGTDGGEIIEVDSKGRKIRVLRYEPPKAGNNLYLSIDALLQEKLFREMKKALSETGSCCGAAVAADPNNGKILALVSLPSFDPNVFSKNENERAINEIFSRTDSPVLNRVIGGTYPPGSTFKIVSALAVLASEKISADTTFEDKGVMNLGPYQFTNWYFNQYGRTEGLVNLAKAIERSNDTYFYKAAQIIGEKNLADWSRKLHLGRALGIDLPGEEKGLVPTDEWKQANYGQVWYPGDTLHMAIGQGFVLTTPLQILGITSYIAGGGILYKPALLLNDQSGIIVSNLAPEKDIEHVKAGMELVTKGQGTAWPFFTFPIPTAGKTGTAEYGDPKNKTHAWYTSFAPADDPEIVLTVLIEGGGEGSSVASPVAKEVYRWYFSPDKNHLIRDISVSATESIKSLGE